jgi:hypothetical protein
VPRLTYGGHDPLIRVAGGAAGNRQGNPSRQASANSLDDGGEGLARTLLAKITKAS